MYFLWVKPCVRLNTFINYTLHNSQYTPDANGNLCPHSKSGIPVMKPHWPLKPDSLGALTPIARPSGWGS